MSISYTVEFKKQLFERIKAGESIRRLGSLPDYPNTRTIYKWLEKEKRGYEFKDIVKKHTEPQEPQEIKRGAKLLFCDVECLPNIGMFFDTYSDRSIPLEFVLEQKSICSIAWKFSDEKEAHALIATVPYSDKEILECFLPIVEQADYIVWHHGEGFDRKFIEGRLFVNRLPALPPTASIDTYKLAKNKFGRTLNSNSLNHIAKTLGLGEKIKVDASLWVKCAKGDDEAMKLMAEYNIKDVELLEQVYYKLAPNVKSKINQNMLYDDAICRCKSCGSENIHLKGSELTAATWRYRYQCGDCTAWSTYPRRKS